jgi:hypothetical protein
MQATDTASVAPGYGARKLRVYRFTPNQAGEQADRAVWVSMTADGLAACCQLTPAEAREIAAGMLNAAAAAEGVAHGC